VINLLGIIVLVIVILMMQGRQKQSMNKLSPLFVDTEFVPTGFPFFTLYNRRVSNIPGVLPYSPE
jgi:L-asparagine transporter-like permease